jgi:hypothetical protein
VTFSPSLGPDDSPQKRLELVRTHCSTGLRFIKGRLEVAAKASPFLDVSPSTYVLPSSKGSFRPKVRSARREIVKKIEEELHQLVSESNTDYDSMRQAHPGFFVFLIAEKNPQRVPMGDLDETSIILREVLQVLPAQHSRHLKTLAKAFVAAHFCITPDAVKKNSATGKKRPKTTVR